MKFLRIRYHKWRARVNYMAYLECELFGCGDSLARAMGFNDFNAICDRVNYHMDKLALLDPDTPGDRL